MSLGVGTRVRYAARARRALFGGIGEIVGLATPSLAHPPAPRKWLIVWDDGGNARERSAEWDFDLEEVP